MELGLKVRRKLLTMALGDHTLMLDLVHPTLKHYANKHGYELVVIVDSLDETRPHFWSKIRAIQNHLPDVDELLWIDVDTVIVDLDVDVRTEIPGDPDFSWATHMVESIPCPNAGVMYFKNSEKSLNLLKIAYEQVDLIDNVWTDNAAFMRVLGYAHEWIPPGPAFASCTDLDVFPLSVRWNCIRQDMELPMGIRHFAGEPLSVRLISICEYLLQPSHITALNMSDTDTAVYLNKITQTLETEVEKIHAAIVTSTLVPELQQYNAKLTERLAAALDDPEAVHARLSRLRAQYESSLSWRLTRPVRTLNTGLRKILSAKSLK